MARKELKGIDVSSWQGKINWKEVKQAGIQFAILRVTERNGIDTQFKRNAVRCELRNIPIGVYKFSYALSPADARLEAEEVVKTLKGIKLSYPVFYDIEWAEQKKLGGTAIEKIVLAFFDVILQAGYEVGIYCNLDWYRTVLTDKLKQYPLWLASYPAKDNGTIVEYLRPSVGMGWQYSSAGSVPGIDGKVDLNVFYENDEEDLNGFTSGPKEEKFEEATIFTAEDALNIMRGWLGYSEANGKHRQIVDIYNSHRPLARGYALSYTDSWCAATISSCFIIANVVDLIGGTECSVQRMIEDCFIPNNIWIEDGTITPKPGDIICFNWDSYSQPNDGWADHIGIVEYVENGIIHTIEGNASHEVRRRTYPVGDGNIRGFARPKYINSPVININPPDKQPAAPPTKTYQDIEAGSRNTLRKDPQCVGRVTASTLAVRSWAGTEFPQIKSYPNLKKDNLVDICDAINGWYYVKIADKYYGFVSSQYIKIV